MFDLGPQAFLASLKDRLVIEWSKSSATETKSAAEL
jgi:hypothetical protein